MLKGSFPGTQLLQRQAVSATPGPGAGGRAVAAGGPEDLRGTRRLAAREEARAGGGGGGGG